MADRARTPAAFFEQLGESLGRTLAARLKVRAAPAIATPVRARRQNGRVHPGDVVAYRQGRGTFNAEVVRIDTALNTATLQRMNDGKRVVRPLDRIYPAS